MSKRIPVPFLEACKHPKEDFFFNLGLWVSIPIAVILFFLVFISFGYALLFIVAFYGLVWLFRAMAKSYLVSNAVRISADNFPEIHQIVDQAKTVLNYQKEVEIFIVEEGSVQAILAKFFNIKYIILHSELVEEMLNDKNIEQLQWVIGRFIAALRIKQLRRDVYKLIIETVEKLQIFNIGILPYERYVQFSGDNVGLVLSGNLEECLKAFNKFLVGNELSNRINFKGILEQGKESAKDPLAVLTRLYATKPHVIDRYVNLLAFAQTYLPNQYLKYISKIQISNQTNIRLPRLYQPNHNLRNIASYTIGIPDHYPPGQEKNRRSQIRERIRISRR